MTNQPPRLVFWRGLLAITPPLALFCVADVFSLAKKLGLAPLQSKAWLGLIGVLILTGLGSLVGLVISFTTRRESLLKTLESVDRAPGWLRWAGYPALLAALVAYPLISLHPYYGDLISKAIWMRLFLFWLLALTGTLAMRLAFPRGSRFKTAWPGALLITVLLQACIQRVSLYLPDLSFYPFALGWSETSRFYYPALFMSREIFGETLAWPILHPSLHFLLLPPYLADLPLWFQRFWQVALRFALVGLIAPALVQRLKISSGRLRWGVGLWVFVCLFTLPLYLHLAVPVIIMLWGFSAHNERRIWFWLVIASIWAGLSRLNWYPMPGMLAAALYFLEVPAQKKGWSTLLKPALWFGAGTLVAFLSMQTYIAFSGIASTGDFFTSLSSSKLWYRLLPNESFSLGVLPGSIIFSAPCWLVLFSAWRRQPLESSARFARGMLLLELMVLFVGGLIVSTKIGGGADIHNMDAYVVLLLVITAYQFKELLNGANPSGSSMGRSLHWGVMALLVFVPAWFGVLAQTSFWRYDPSSSRDTLAALQQRVDQVNKQNGEILFITQRHLISMHMLNGVRLVPEYEREELMEMAMAQNDAYLQKFRADLEKHRFAAIVVDPLRFNFVGEHDAIGAENNAWTRYVVKKVLCSYQQDAIFPADRIAIYVPQVGAQKCP